jgi:hypothetical protein
MQKHKRSYEEHLAEIKKTREDYEARIANLDKNFNFNMDI